MASTKLFVILSIVGVVLLPSVTVATEFLVGDASGWTTGCDYQAWAKDKVFHVDDLLVFKYPEGAHNVFKVNATEFQDCIKPPMDKALTSGNDRIRLGTPGEKYYFICGVANHCAKHGQKLVIYVEEAGSAPAPVLRISLC